MRGMALMTAALLAMLTVAPGTAAAQAAWAGIAADAAQDEDGKLAQVFAERQRRSA